MKTIVILIVGIMTCIQVWVASNEVKTQLREELKMKRSDMVELLPYSIQTVVEDSCIVSSLKFKNKI